MSLRTILLATAPMALAACGEPNEFVPPPPPPVTVAQPLRQPVTTNAEYTGRLEARDTVELRARVRGFLDTVNLDPTKTQIVEAGEVLFVIEQAPFRAAVDAAQAAVDRAKAELELAETTLVRARTAYEREALTEIELKEREAERDVKAAAVKAAAANLANAQLDLDYTTIASPVKGRASRELVDAGNLVGSSENTLLTTIVVDDPIYAYFNISERELLGYLQTSEDRRERSRVRPMVVQMRLTDGSLYEHTGVVTFADNRVDPGTGTLQVRATFPNEESRLFPGLFCRVLVPNELGEALLVPELAIQRDIVGPYLLVVDAQDTVQRADVRLGPITGRMRVVEEGLQGDERVVVNGLQRARPGVVVNATEAPAAADAPPASGS